MPRTGIHNRLGNLKQENPMNVNHYIGFDVHKKSISYCVRTADGTILRRGKGGLWDIRTHSCPTAQRFVSDPPAVPRLPRTARRSFSSRCAIQTVSRPAGSLKFNLRGRRYAVPANGCLVTLMRWPNLQRIQFGKSAQTVNPATVASPEILPISPRRCVFSLDKSLSWMSLV